MNRILFSVFAVALLACGARTANACDCGQVSGERVPARKWLADFKGAVFLGKAIKVVEVQVPLDEGRYTLEREVTFKVEQSWKGAESAEVKIRTGIGGGDCGVPYVEGERYFVVAHLLEGKLKTDICGYTSLSDATKTIKELGKGKRPKKE